MRRPRPRRLRHASGPDSVAGGLQIWERRLQGAFRPWKDGLRSRGSTGACPVWQPAAPAFVRGPGSVWEAAACARGIGAAHRGALVAASGCQARQGAAGAVRQAELGEAARPRLRDCSVGAVGHAVVGRPRPSGQGRALSMFMELLGMGCRGCGLSRRCCASWQNGADLPELDLQMPGASLLPSLP